MNGQILPCGYNFDVTLMVLREMVDDSVLDLVENHLVTDHISLHVSYGKSEGEMAEDAGGDASGGLRRRPGQLFDGGHGIRRVGGARPHGGGSRKIPERTNSFAKLYGYLEALFREYGGSRSHYAQDQQSVLATWWTPIWPRWTCSPMLRPPIASGAAPRPCSP